MTVTKDKYKEWALKSGFPLENDALSIVNRCLSDAKVVRNIEFIAMNEEGAPAIRSVDLVASISKKTKNIPHRDWPSGQNEFTEINFVIDCKYATDESFLFIPSNKVTSLLERSWLNLIPVLKEDELCRESNIHRKDFIEFAKVDASLKIASSGRKVKEQSKERDSTYGALLQVLQGTYHFIETKAGALGTTSEVSSDYQRNTHFFIPIIVTNAPILLLNEEISLEQVSKSTSREQLFSDVNSILVEMPNSFDLKESLIKIKQTVVTSGNDPLGWHENGLESSHVLFCNPFGLEQFLFDIVTRFGKLERVGR